MVTSNDKWFNEMDGEPAVPSSRKMHGSGARGNSSAGPAREDYVMTRSTAFHKSGQAYQESFCAGSRSVDMMTKYWTDRGLPGTRRNLIKGGESVASEHGRSGQAPGLAQDQPSPTKAFLHSLQPAS